MLLSQNDLLLSGITNTIHRTLLLFYCSIIAIQTQCRNIADSKKRIWKEYIRSLALKIRESETRAHRQRSVRKLTLRNTPSIQLAGDCLTNNGDHSKDIVFHT